MGGHTQQLLGARNSSVARGAEHFRQSPWRRVRDDRGLKPQCRFPRYLCQNPLLFQWNTCSDSVTRGTSYCGGTAVSVCMSGIVFWTGNPYSKGKKPSFIQQTFLSTCPVPGTIQVTGIPRCMRQRRPCSSIHRETGMACFTQ